MKSILVARVSTEEQRDAGNSLPAQVVRMEAYCQRKNLDIIKTFEFDESAYKEKRDQFDEVLEFIDSQNEKIAVCFDKVDRLSRNVFDKRVPVIHHKAVSGEIELHFVSEGQVVHDSMSAQENFAFGIGLGLAKYYSDAISDNTKRAFEQKRRVGEWIGNPRIGYMRVQTRDDAGGIVSRDIVPDPERAHLIVKLFELYASGEYSYTTAWKKITKLGLRSIAGKKLSRSNVELILKDSFYHGKAVSKKYGEYPHKYEKLIDKPLFDKCQQIREGRKKAPSKETGKPFMFRGLLPCKNCGCTMSPEIKKGKFIYYSCTNSKGICKRVYVPEKKLLEPIYEVFEAFAGIPQKVQDRLVAELRKTNESEAVFHQNAISRIRAEYDRIQGRVERLLDLLLDGGITQDEHAKKLQEMKKQQERLNIELEEHTKADHQYHIHVSTVLDLSRRMGEIFESSETNEKRAILNFLIQNPSVDGKKLMFDLRSPFGTVLEVAHQPTGLRG